MNPQTNQTYPRLTALGIYPNFELYKLIYFWIISVTFQFVPLTILIVLNSYLMKYMHKSFKNKNFTPKPSITVENQALTRQGKNGLSSLNSDSIKKKSRKKSKNANSIGGADQGI